MLSLYRKRRSAHTNLGVETVRRIVSLYDRQAAQVRTFPILVSECKQKKLTSSDKIDKSTLSKSVFTNCCTSSEEE